MKTSFKTKLTQLLLGVTLGLGVAVGVTAGGGKASEVRAGTNTVVFTVEEWGGSTSTSYVTTATNGTGTVTGSTDTVAATMTQFIPSSGQVKGNQTNVNNNWSMYNSDPIPGSITKIAIAGNGTWQNNLYCAVGTSSVSSQTDTSKGTDWSSNRDWSFNSSSNYKYFKLYSNKKFTSGNVQKVSVTVTYEIAVTKYDVSFSMQGHGTAPSTQSIEAGGKVSEPTAPSVSGYIFDGWYEEAACTNKWDFDTGTISGTKVLYAKWTAKTALQLAADDVNLKLGDSDEPVAVTAGGSPVTGGYTLTSGKTSVISIVNNQLHVVGRGDATITITKAEDANNTYTSGTFNVHVDYADITSFELDYTEGTLGKGGIATLPGVTILPANANQGFSWGDPNVSATSGEILYKFENGILSIDSNNTGEGKITFVATADGDKSKSADVVYTIEAAQIAHITSVNASATGEIVSKQYVGVAFNPQGFSFTPSWSEGEHEEVVIGANDISWNALVAGSNPTGTYSCADGDFTVTIEGVTVANDTLVSIAFAEGCKMSKTSYWVGDSWDFSGLSIVGTMDSGKTAPAIASSNVTFSSNDAVATTTTSITVTAEYNNLTATKEISDIVVNEVTMDSLTVNYTGGQPVLGTNFTFAGSITANMSNGTHPTVKLSDVTIGSVDKFTTNQQTITVTHKSTGATGTFNVQYQAKSYTEDVETPGSASWTADKSDSLYHKSTSPAESGTLTLGIFTLNWEHNGYNGWGGDADGHRLGQSSTGTIEFTSSTPANVKITGITVVCGGNKSASSGSATVTVGSVSKTPIAFSGAGNADRDFTFDKATGAISIAVSCNSLFRMKGITINYLSVEQESSTEKHAIRIGEVTCNKSPLIAGETISKSDFKIQVQYDTGTGLTSNLTPTNVSPTTLVAGTHDYTITYTGSYNDTVTKVIQLTAKAPAVLESINITKDVECDDVFTRNDTFTHNGIHVIAHYTDSTEYPDADVTANADITPPDDMNVAGTKTINVSYEENGVTKTTSYQITVNPIVSTYLTLSGEGIEGSNGVYTLNSEVSNTVNLTIDKDGDEEIDVTNQTSFLSYSKTTGVLTINSSTTTSESGTITFTAGSRTATLTVNVSAAEAIELKSDKTITGYVGDSFSYDVKIELHNVASATWTIPTGDDFNIETTSQDNTGFVGTISFTKEITEAKEIKFSALTGKDKTLSVAINVLAANDNIKTISASLKSGVTYTAGQGQTFSKDDLTVTFKRDSGAEGTLNSDEFTVSGLPEGSFTRVGSYKLTITSVEDTEATDSLTINVGMPKDQFGNDLNFVTKTIEHHDGTTSTSWELLTNKSQLSANEKLYLYLSSKGYVTGVSGSDATVSTNEADRLEFEIEITNATNGEFKLKSTSGSTKGKYISSIADNKFNIAASQNDCAIFQISSDTEGLIYYTDSKSATRMLAANGSYLRCYKTGSSSYSYFSAYISKTTKSEPWDESIYNDNAMTETIYNFIAKANESYIGVCKTADGNNKTPLLDDWLSAVYSDIENKTYTEEFAALIEDKESFALLQHAVCGDGNYDEMTGLYSGSKDYESSKILRDFIEKYDRVVSLYSKGDKGDARFDYLGRIEAGMIKSPNKFNLSLFGVNSLFANTSNTTWVVLTLVTAGLASVGYYFFSKKRKEN